MPRFLKELLQDVTPERKQATIKAIEQANSKAYQRQVASHHLVNKVIDDMLNDPFWYEVVTEIIESRKDKS